MKEYFYRLGNRLLDFIYGQKKCQFGRRIGMHDGYGGRIVPGVYGLDCEGCRRVFNIFCDEEEQAEAERRKAERIAEYRTAFRLALEDLEKLKK